jgi:hypothetical protein
MPSLDEVLDAHPTFADALRWTVPDGSPFVWRLWPEDKKARLRIRFQQYLSRSDVGAAIPRYVGSDRRHQQVEPLRPVVTAGVPHRK